MCGRVSGTFQPEAGAVATLPRRVWAAIKELRAASTSRGGLCTISSRSWRFSARIRALSIVGSPEVEHHDHPANIAPERRPRAPASARHSVDAFGSNLRILLALIPSTLRKMTLPSY
jgi:hypothetical protein